MKVLLTGGNGMVGKAIRRLQPTLAPDWRIIAPSSKELNLLDRASVHDFFKNHDFDLVIHCAAKVGGIKANIANPVEFLSENLLMNTHIIEEARLADVQNFINLGSSCMYPRNYKNPLLEDYILEAPLEPTNEGYALAKISAERHCRYIASQHGLTYRTLIPCNLYGVGDHFDPVQGHLISAVILKIHNAIQANEASVEIWGDGTARREFMYVDDLASFILKCTDSLKDMPPALNVGLGIDHSVNEYYKTIANVLGYEGNFTHNLDAPAGMQQKLMDSSKAKIYGWAPSTSLEDGIRKSYEYFLNNK